MGQDYGMMSVLFLLAALAVMASNPMALQVSWSAAGWTEYLTDEYSQAVAEFVIARP